MIINGAGTTQRQSDWTVQGLFNEYFAEGLKITPLEAYQLLLEKLTVEDLKGEK